MIPALKCGIVLGILGWIYTPRNWQPAPEKDWLEDDPIPLKGVMVIISLLSRKHNISYVHHLPTWAWPGKYIHSWIYHPYFNTSSKADVEITFPMNYQLIYDSDIEASWMSRLTLHTCHFTEGRREEGKAQAHLNGGSSHKFLCTKLEHLLSFQLGNWAVPDFETLCLCTSL